MPAISSVEPRGGADESLDVRAGGTTLAGCSLWWTNAPLLDGRRTGFIGDYTCTDERAARVLLDGARERLIRSGVATAVGPVDGDTWHRYRFVTRGGAHPPFFLEPENPDVYPRDWSSAGFTPLARYVSVQESMLDRPDPRAARAAARLARAGVVIRRFDPARWDAELDAIYDVATIAFAGNLLYSPIARADFRALYDPLRGRVDPDFARIAQCDGRPVGFAFGVPDYAAVARGEALDTIVGKTQARLPGLRYAGLGSAMLADVRRTARARGMRRIVHALIHCDNVALNASRRVAEPIREYTLFASRLV